MKRLLLTCLATVATISLAAQNYLEHEFLNPKDEHKPIIIWQWMDGLVKKKI